MDNGVQVPRGSYMADKLNPAETFPALTLNLAGGGNMSLPEDLDSAMTVVLFYRGHW